MRASQLFTVAILVLTASLYGCSVATVSESGAQPGDPMSDAMADRSTADTKKVAASIALLPAGKVDATTDREATSNNPNLEARMPRDLVGDWSTYLCGNSSGDNSHVLFRDDSEITLIDFEIPIPIITKPARAFVIAKDSDSALRIDGVESLDEQGLDCQPMQVELVVKDYNFDGLEDLRVGRLDQLMTDASDFILTADSDRTGLPYHVLPVTDSVINFQSDLLAWSVDHEYFVKNAPLRITSISFSAFYWGFTSEDDAFALSIFLLLCENDVGVECAVSVEDPSQCVHYLRPADSLGNPLGDAVPTNVCNRGFNHIYVINQSIAVERDFSVFDQDALNFARTIEIKYPGGIEQLIFERPTDDTELWNQLSVIVKHVLGEKIFGRESNGTETGTSEEYELNCDLVGDILQGPEPDHPAFESDLDVNSSDLTFHHYDVNSAICIGDPPCTLGPWQYRGLNDTVLTVLY